MAWRSSSRAFGDSVLYYAPFELADPQEIWGHSSEMPAFVSVRRTRSNTRANIWGLARHIVPTTFSFCGQDTLVPFLPETLMVLSAIPVVFPRLSTKHFFMCDNYKTIRLFFLYLGDRVPFFT